MSKKTKRTLIIGAVVLAVMIFASIYTVAIKPKLDSSYYKYDETEIFEGTLQVGVSESGSLDFTIENITYDIDVNVTGDDDDDDDDDDEEKLTQRYLEIAEVYAVSGMKVKEGDKLIKFSDESITAVRKLLQSALADAKADYNTAESEFNLSVLEAQIDLEKQQVAGKYASTIYKGDKADVTNSISSMENQIALYYSQIPDLQEKIADAYEDYVEALDNYNEVKAYYDDMLVNNPSGFYGYVSTYNNAKSTYERALETFQNAENKLVSVNNSVNELTRSIEDAKAKQNIEKLGIEETYNETVLYNDYAEIIYNSKYESLKEDLEEALEDKEAIEDKLEAFEALVGEDGILYAPKDGVITASNYEQGDKLETTGTLFSYATDENMTITVTVTEEDIISLAVGDVVSIEFNAYEDELFNGTITSINTTATSRGTPTISYEVEVLVEGTLDKLYGGMTANITFVTKQSDNTMYISRKALTNQNGNYYVYKKTGLNGKELTEVTIGIKNETYVEILSGLSADDTIYIATLVNGKED